LVGDMEGLGTLEDEYAGDDVYCQRYKTWQGSIRACAAPDLMETASTAPLVMHTWNNFLITKRNTTGI